MCVCRCLYKRRWYYHMSVFVPSTYHRIKFSGPHPERRVIAKQIFCGNTLPHLIQLEKLIQIFLLNFGASKVHTKETNIRTG